MKVFPNQVRSGRKGLEGPDLFDRICSLLIIGLLLVGLAMFGLAQIGALHK